MHLGYLGVADTTGGYPVAVCNVGTSKFSTDFQTMIRTNVASMPPFAIDTFITFSVKPQGLEF